MKATATAKLRQLRVSPRKVRLLVDLVRGMDVAEAKIQLELSKKHAARALIKLLDSALANAVHNHNVDAKTAVLKVATVDGGPTLHRWTPRAFGRASRINKRTSHITLTIEGDVVETKKTKTARKEKKEVAKEGVVKDEAAKVEKPKEEKRKAVTKKKADK